MMMNFDITKMVEEIVMQAKENQEEFIIETIYPYCENILQMKINKEELKQILLNGIQKPCENCVSREAIIEWIDKSVAQYGGTYSTDMLNMWGLFKDWISHMPSVTPQPKTGHWEDCSNGWMCSNCYRDVTYESDFCPICGADMRGDEG